MQTNISAKLNNPWFRDLANTRDITTKRLDQATGNHFNLLGDRHENLRNLKVYSKDLQMRKQGELLHKQVKYLPQGYKQY